MDRLNKLVLILLFTFDKQFLKQIFSSVLLFERLRVDEPKTFLRRQRIYADVLIKISDKVLAGKRLDLS